MRLAKVIIILSFLLFSATSFASEYAGPPLSKITVNLNTEHWVTSQTAKVTISVNATLQSSDLAALQKQIMTDLNKLHQGEWRITSFYRSQDQSGLERATLEAEVRLPEAGLADIRDKVEALSKPGQKFMVISIDYTPSFAELNQAQADMRKALYENAQAELDVVNKQYTDRHYVLYDFSLSGLISARVSPAYKRMNTAVSMLSDVGNGAEEGNSMSVSQRLELSAQVTFAAVMSPAV